MKTISVVDAQKQLTDLIEDLKEGPVVLLSKGRPCAALVGLDEHFDRESFSLGRDKALRRLLDQACRRTKEEGGIPFSEILREVDRQHPSGKKRPRRPRAKDSTVS
jgi:antitoxin (DNA-binding transcriptional repressor) of toxin-antitoxin stability system